MPVKKAPLKSCLNQGCSIKTSDLTKVRKRRKENERKPSKRGYAKHSVHSTETKSERCGLLK